MNTPLKRIFTLSSDEPHPWIDEKTFRRIFGASVGEENEKENNSEKPIEPLVLPDPQPWPSGAKPRVSSRSPD